ncbi:glycosyltransferase [Salinirussus salinus]|uniref:glycosyltransferase n=1 Tax=Salinirussus salinus TaxID=1198300 RepID=UPI00135BCAE8|nr:glycosyltransferase [Salinirussus salinus]
MGDGVVSVGSFHPNKRQLFQLRIASRFPETRFRIVGSVSSESYYERCEQYISDHALDNVNLLTDISDRDLYDILDRSGIFFHTMQNERFGIATVEGLNHGCIPVVHDSGGQREVVPDSKFRFNTTSDCVSTLKRALSGRHPDDQETKEHLRQFTRKRFQEMLSSII